MKVSQDISRGPVAMGQRGLKLAQGCWVAGRRKSQGVLGLNPTPPFPGCVPWGKLLSLSDAQLPL